MSISNAVNFFSPLIQIFYREEFLHFTTEIEKIIDNPYAENILGMVGG
jgi:hypothetical protein